MRYFNTFGGNPVAIAAAQETLDVIRDEELVSNARSVGDYLRSGIEKLAERFEAIGEVRGSGLFIGVELVTDRDSRSPDEPLALAVVNGLRDRRVLISASGPHNNVLKVRPPLPFSAPDADRFLTELDAVLRSVSAPASP